MNTTSQMRDDLAGARDGVTSGELFTGDDLAVRDGANSRRGSEMDLKHLMQRITSTNGIDIRDSAHVRVPAGEIRAALAEVGVMRRERDDLAARLAKVEQAEPVAWVPMHPRFGALWAMTTATPSEERLPSHYPLSPLYASSAPAAAPERENIIEAQVRTLTAERDEARAELAQARDVLSRLEWDSWGYDPYAEGRSHCPCCGWTKDEGHAPDCALNAALAAKGE